MDLILTNLDYFLLVLVALAAVGVAAERSGGPR